MTDLLTETFNKHLGLLRSKLRLDESHSSDFIRIELLHAMNALTNMKKSKSYRNDQLDTVRKYITGLEKLYRNSVHDMDLTNFSKEIKNMVDSHPELLLIGPVVTQKFYDQLTTSTKL